MTIRKISHTAREYATVKAELEAVVKEVAPDFWTDMFQSNLGVMFIDLISLIGDSVSYGQDAFAQEMFLATARRYESGLRFAKAVGYKPRSAVSASVVVTARDLPASLVSNGGTVAAGVTITGSNGLSYELLSPYTILVGASYVKLPMRQCKTYGTALNEFTPSNKPYQTITLPEAVVDADSWSVYVGVVGLANLWTEVDNVDLEVGPTKTYSTTLDDRGRLVLRFGDNARGAIPDQTVSVSYRSTEGASGNTPSSTIIGTIPISLGGGGTASVQFVNTDEPDNSQVEYLVSFESAGVTLTTGAHNSILVYSPIVVGSLTLTFTLPGIFGTIVIRDNGAGAFTIISQPGGFSIASSSIGYAAATWAVTFNAWSTSYSGGAITAEYRALQAANIAGIISGSAIDGLDRESLDELKRNIPAYIASQRRIVTLEDYATVARQITGVALVAADKLQNSYNGNYVRVAVWGSESIAFVATSPDGVSSTTTYKRYKTADDALLNTAQAALEARTLVTVANQIVPSAMLWCDVYLKDVYYDQTLTTQEVHLAINAAVVSLFEKSTGFVIRLADLTSSIANVEGVKYFTLERITTGTQAFSSELQSATAATLTVSGTLALNQTADRTVIVPKSVSIIVDQPTGSITATDNGLGSFIIVSGTRSVASSSINYNTGAWTITFSGSTLSPSRPVVASYSDVTKDYRSVQLSVIDGSVSADDYPPPGITITGYPITPPYFDGRPDSVLRTGTDVTATIPYMVGDETRYARLQDISALNAPGSVHYYNGQYRYNGEIKYDSIFGTSSPVRAINLRKLSFNLVPTV